MLFGIKGLLLKLDEFIFDGQSLFIDGCRSGGKVWAGGYSLVFLGGARCQKVVKGCRSSFISLALSSFVSLSSEALWYSWTGRGFRRLSKGVDA